MKLSVGDKLVLKDKLIEYGQTHNWFKNKKIVIFDGLSDNKTCYCTECGKQHGPVFKIIVDNPPIRNITKCEIKKVSLDKRINNLLKL